MSIVIWSLQYMYYVLVKVVSEVDKISYTEALPHGTAT